MATTNIKINNKMNGENKEEVTRWFTVHTLKSLLEIADPGDIIELNRSTYSHWAIYAGVEKKEALVVYLGLDDSGRCKPQILKQPLSKVLSNTQKIRINNTLDRRTRLVSPADDISLVNQRIEEFVNEKKPYHMIHNNCEHFVNFCRYGGIVSNQSRLIPITFLILCFDGVLFHRDLIPPLAGSALQLNCSHTVPLLRGVTKCEISPWDLGACLIYILACFRVMTLLAAFCMTYGFVKNALFSLCAEMRMCAVIIATLAAYFINPVDVSKMELGPYASSTIVSICVSVFVLYCGFFPKFLLNKLSLVFGALLPIVVLGPNFVVTLFLMMYIYEIIRLSHLDATEHLAFLNFTVAFSYLLHVFGMVFPMVFLVMIIVDDIIRLKLSVHQGKLNFIASIILCVYLSSVFDFLHATMLIALCIVEIYQSEISQRLDYKWNFGGWTANLCAYGWKCINSDNWESEIQC